MQRVLASLPAFLTYGNGEFVEDTSGEGIDIKGYISFNLSLSSTGDPTCEDQYNENQFTTKGSNRYKVVVNVGLFQYRDPIPMDAQYMKVNQWINYENGVEIW